jgi:hypothetical protein
MSMVMLYIANAFIQDANLWPLIFIFAMPCIYVYLLVLIGVRAVRERLRRPRKVGS